MVVLPEVEVADGVEDVDAAAAVRIVEETLAGEGWTVFDLEGAGELPSEVRECTAATIRRCGYVARRLLRVDVLATVHVSDPALLEVVLTGASGVGVRGRGQIDPSLDDGAPDAAGLDRPSLRFAAADAVREAARRYGSAAPPQGVADYGEAPERAPSFDPGTRTEASPLNWLLGGFLAAGSVPLIGFAINTAVRDGDCVTAFGDACVERIRFREGAAIFLGAGVLLLAGGIYTLIAQPIRVVVTASPRSAGLGLEGTF